MTDKNLHCLQQEWTTLQNQFDHYEKVSLLIKMFNVFVTAYLLFVLSLEIWAGAFCTLVWLQDGIWKTFQARISVRLEQIEIAIQQSIADEKSEQILIGMQFNSAWSKERKGIVGLVLEYLKQSFKPTVAYPHVLLLIFVFLQ